ncbi:TPA: WxL domain-containing protein [Enterococcus faecium]
MKKHVTLFSSVLMMSTTLLGAGGVFADSNIPSPNTAKTPVSAVLSINETPDKPTPPVTPEGGGDTATDIEGLFGIAYTPSSLSGSKQLEEKGTTEVALTNQSSEENKFNVGVQDKTRGKDRAWTLKAQLSWDGDEHGYMDGATITAIQGNVKGNDGKGNLTDLEQSEVTTEAQNLTIQKDSEVTIMSAQKGKTINGVYNYQFKDPKLVIPNSENVTSGTYSGNITWNLSNAME